MVIFTRTFDLLAWLLPHTNHFPRAHRYPPRRLQPSPVRIHREAAKGNLQAEGLYHRSRGQRPRTKTQTILRPERADQIRFHPATHDECGTSLPLWPALSGRRNISQFGPGALPPARMGEAVGLTIPSPFAEPFCALKRWNKATFFSFPRDFTARYFAPLCHSHSMC